MLPTESAVQVQDDRQRLLDLLDRQEVIDELEKYGITKVEAASRINSLSDEEILTINNKLSQFPSGGQAIPAGTNPRYFFMFIGFLLDMIWIALKGILCTITFTCKKLGGKEWVLKGLFWEYGTPDAIGEPSREMKSKARCYSRCNSIAYECLNLRGLTNKSEPQCNEEQLICFQQCNGEKESVSVPIEEDCDPGMESCT
jgi:hypothetical protein